MGCVWCGSLGRGSHLLLLLSRLLSHCRLGLGELSLELELLDLLGSKLGHVVGNKVLRDLVDLRRLHALLLSEELLLGDLGILLAADGVGKVTLDQGGCLLGLIPVHLLLANLCRHEGVKLKSAKVARVAHQVLVFLVQLALVLVLGQLGKVVDQRLHASCGSSGEWDGLRGI